MKRGYGRMRIIILQLSELVLSVISLVLFALSILPHFNSSDETLERLTKVVAVNLLFLSLLCVATLLFIWGESRRTRYIYISYAEKGRKVAKLTRKILEEYFQGRPKRHFEIWTSEDVPCGANISETIDRYVQKASVFIIVLTEDYIINEKAIKEYLQAMEQGKKIIPVVINSADILRELPREPGDIKALSLSEAGDGEDYKRAVIKLMEEIEDEIWPI